MATLDRLTRNIKPVEREDEDQESYHTEEEHDSVDETGEDELGDDGTDEELSQIQDNADQDSADEDDEPVAQQLSAVSFGALKKANDMVSKKRKAGTVDGPDQEAKLESLKKRLRLIKDQQPSTLPRKRNSTTAIAPSGGIIPDRDEYSDSDSDDSGPEEVSMKGRAKHAPASQSSKYQVSRKRQVIDVPKRTTRDPRFDAVTNDAARPEHRENAYSFLRDYQESEMAELKSAMKKTKSSDDKDTLRRKLNAMENRVKAREAKEREQDIIRKHRKQEREQVREGKTPFYLKRSEIKQQALVDKFDKMKSKDREKLMERRRKKESQKERRRMPEQRRGIAS